MDPSIRDTIARVAQEEGVDPAYALAVADRESSGNPYARNSKTIAGLFQMTGGLRHQYGAGDSADPETQTRAWSRFIGDTKKQMGAKLGRDVTDSEAYLGHFWGPDRAARVLSGAHAGATPSDVFSPYELSINPELARGRSAGGLASTIMADIDRRKGKYGGNGDNSIDFSQYGQGEPTDFAQYGQAEISPAGASKPGAKIDMTGNVGKSPPINPKTDGVPPERTGTEIDLAQFGTPPPTTQPDFSQFAAQPPQA